MDFSHSNTAFSLYQRGVAIMVTTRSFTQVISQPGMAVNELFLFRLRDSRPIPESAESCLKRGTVDVHYTYSLSPTRPLKVLGIEGKFQVF